MTSLYAPWQKKILLCFFNAFPLPSFIDEVQYAPELFSQIKLLADNLGTPGAFWLSGSQPFEFMQGVSQSLAGRVCVLRLAGLSAIEKTSQIERDVPFLPTQANLATRSQKAPTLDLPALYEQIWRGSFPKLYQEPQTPPHVLYNSSMQTYVERDIRQLSAVANLSKFVTFLRIVAARTAQIINFSDLARDADIAVNTAKSWLSILQTSGIVYLLEPLHRNITKRLIKSPKLYLLDTGLCAYLTQWSTATILQAGAMAGPLFKTWVVGEILKSYWHYGLQCPMYFYRDKEQREIDIVFTKDGQLYPIEVKRSASPTSKDVKHFQHLATIGPIGAGALISLHPESFPLTHSITHVPIGWL